MSAQVIHIEARRFKPMSCPDHETLVLIAEGSEDQEDSTRAHLDLCSSCSAQVADLRAELQEWRATGIVEEERFDDSYFANLANDVEKAITAASTPPVAVLPIRQPSWRTPLSLAAALAASVLLVVSALQEPAPTPESVAALDTADSLEAMAREIGRSLLIEAEQEAVSDDPATFLATWKLEQHDPLDEPAPFPLTTTLADEFELLDSDFLDSLVLRL